MTQMSMNEGHDDYDNEDAHLMNSSFYSSISMNTLDHAKNFRNSLIMKDFSDQSLATYMESTDEFGDSQLNGGGVPIGNEKMNAKGGKERETSTMQMKNSPSLSALAGILNEKSKEAEEKARLNRVIDESILEEGEEEEEEGNKQSNEHNKISQVNSPNLIDINDTNVIDYSSMPKAIDSALYEQPDFLSTPRVNPPPNRNSGYVNNPFITEEPLFKVQPDIQEEPDLESRIDTPVFKTRRRSNTATEFETNPTGVSSGIRRTSLSSFGFQEQSSFADPPPMYTKEPASASAIDLHRPNEGSSNNNNIVDTNVSNRNEIQTHSKASAAGAPVQGPRSRRFRSNTIDNVDTRRSNSNMLEKNNFQEKLETPPRRRNLRSSKTTPHTSQNSPSQQHHKRRSIFSFFKRKSSKETTPKKSKQNNKRHPTGMSSASLNSNANMALSSTPEKLTKKSHSTNTIFCTFRKHKDKEDTTLLSMSTPPKNESQLDAISKESSSFSSGRREPYTSIESGMEKSKTEPWDEPQLLAEDLQQKEYPSLERTQSPPFENNSYIREGPAELEKREGLGEHDYVQNEEILPEAQRYHENTDSNDPLAEDFPKPILPFLARHDAGEALFPKSLDKHEVESIVSLERSRSVKSNRSHRRSLTDTLSVNAQNEGMYVMEASPAMISTPDLSKSPTGSILRNGRFESITSSAFDEGTEASPFEKRNSEIIPQLTLSPQRESMGSIEGKFNQLVLIDDDDDDDDDDDEHVDNKDTGKIHEIIPTPNTYVKNHESSYDTRAEQQQGPQNLDDDQEFTTEMMEFASLINFGDGFNLDLDVPPNVNAEYTSSLRGDSPRRITNAEPIFSLDAGSENEQNNIPDEGIEKSVSEDDKIHEITIEQYKEQIPTNVEFDDDGCMESTYHPSTHNEVFVEQESQGQSTDIPNDLLDDIKGPTLNSNFEAFDDEGEVHQGRHSFRDILTNAPEISDPLSNHHRLSMSFKGLNAPSLNHNAFESPLFNSPVITPDSPMQTNTRVNFSSKIVLYDTYDLEEYDRKPELATCNMLTPQLAQMIKTELNELKNEMEIHEASRCYTHFF